MAKFGLCIGIDEYAAEADRLRGAASDARDWSAQLTQSGFQVELLLNRAASRSGVLGAMDAVIAAAGENDSLVVTYSGHGTYVADTPPVEPDNRDEALVTVDGDVILDDELFIVFSRTKSGAKLVFLADCCSSGTITELQPTKHTRFIDPNRLERDVIASARRRRRELGSISPQNRSLLLSACEGSNATAEEITIGNKSNGAFTRAALNVFPRAAEGTYEQWHELIVPELKTLTSEVQNPQIFGTDEQKAWRVFS